MKTLKTLNIQQKERYVIVQLNRGTANAINMEMLEELQYTFQHFSEDKNISGVILTGKPNFFSAGLDLIELYDYDKPKMDQFFYEFSNTILTLARFPKPLIAAISGHSPAGGCVLAIGCDYRIMASGKYKIGLNEIPVGMIVPNTIFHLYSFWIGQKNAYQYLLEGRLMNPEHAQNIGLVDEVVDVEEVLAVAEKKMQQYLQFDTTAWQTTKRNFRQPLLNQIDVDFETVFRPTAKHWWSPSSRATMAGIISQLQKK